MSFTSLYFTAVTFYYHLMAVKHDTAHVACWGKVLTEVD